MLAKAVNGEYWTPIAGPNSFALNKLNFTSNLHTSRYLINSPQTVEEFQHQSVHLPGLADMRLVPATWDCTATGVGQSLRQTRERVRPQRQISFAPDHQQQVGDRV